jgi:hypothetical protein
MNTPQLMVLILKDNVRKVLFIERKESYITGYNFKIVIRNF